MSNTEKAEYDKAKRQIAKSISDNQHLIDIQREAVTGSRTVASKQIYRFSRKHVKILEGDCEAFLNVRDRETLEKQINGQWHVWSNVNGGWQ